MSKISLAPGIWTATVTSVVSGAALVTGATTSQWALQLVGWISLAFSFLFLVWGFRIDGAKWWNRFIPATKNLHHTVVGTFDVSEFQETAHPIGGAIWSNLKLVSEEFCRQAAENITTSRPEYMIPKCAKKLISCVKVYGIYPGFERSTIIPLSVLLEGELIVNGRQLDLRGADGRDIARFLHVHTEDTTKAISDALMGINQGNIK